MTHSISDGVTTVTPTLIDGYSSTRASRNIVHELLSVDEPIAVSIRPSNPRSGRLRARFDTAEDAVEAELMLAADSVFSLASTGQPSVAMAAFTTGEVVRELTDTRTAWWVIFDFQELP